MHRKDQADKTEEKKSFSLDWGLVTLVWNGFYINKSPRHINWKLENIIGDNSGYIETIIDFLKSNI